MSRRVPLPGADELFRSTSTPMTRRTVEEPTPPAQQAVADDQVSDLPGAAPVRRVGQAARRRPSTDQRRSTGRERHEEKITVYVSSDELIDIEQARLVLRREHGVAVDRGRIVREAIAVVLADLEATGDDSILVRRLAGP